MYPFTTTTKKKKVLSFASKQFLTLKSSSCAQLWIQINELLLMVKSECVSVINVLLAVCYSQAQDPIYYD